MTEACFLQSLGIAGFRAFLGPRTFDFSKKRCLAIFAPNGYGKSSVVDALEFMLSKEGTLIRLGQRAVHNQAGPVALVHNLAAETNITPSVEICVISGKDRECGSRTATGVDREMPAVGKTLNAHFKVSPIVRGHELRRFVEARTPEQRYADIANWLQLGPLVAVQKSIRLLRMQIKAAAEDERDLQRVDTQLARETAQLVRAWETTPILTHINKSILAPLDPVLTLTALATADGAYVALEARAEEEADKIGLAGLRQIRNATAALKAETTDAENGKVVISGAIPTFDMALVALSSATTREEEERKKSANAVFQSLWKAAEPFFAEGTPAPDVCPVCATPIAATATGSSEGIRIHIAQHLEELADYAAAKRALEEADRAVTKAHAALAVAVTALMTLLDDETSLKADLNKYQDTLSSWPDRESPVSAEVVAAIASHILLLDGKIADIEARQGEHTYVKAKTKIDRLLELQTERDVALRTKSNLADLSAELTKQGTKVSAAIRTKVQSLLDSIQTPTNEIYKSIQGSEAAEIHLQLPAEDDANQQRLNLLVDFAENRTGVQPSGYLSDSQIHSVALALRMAAIEQFNSSGPIMVLDDIVTSYDADHRRAIAGLVATKLRECQVLITTHDERFFSYLKDQLGSKTWHFTRIIGLDPTYGPRFADHKVSDEMIEKRWSDGESAANEMRQAEEEWLLGICRDFGVSVRIRPLEKAYTYERSELALALAAFLKNARLRPEDVAGVNNRFVASLAKGEIENFGSHFQEGPYGNSSIGNETTRWGEFNAFRDQFVCKECKRTRFQRPVTLRKPVCAHEGCETQFAFSVPS